MSTLQVKRGPKATIASTGLTPGEFLFTNDTGELYICKDATTKILLATADELLGYLRKDQNLSDVDSLSAARTNLDVYSKVEVDQLIAGLKWKNPVRAVASANVTLTGAQTIDDVVLADGDRVLVKSQTDPKTNGIYVVAAGAWARSSDADGAAELKNAAVFVGEGTTYADTAWVCTTDNIALGTSNITWVQFAGSSTYVGGNGIDVTGNNIELNLSELTAQATIDSTDYIVFIDVSAAGTARNKKILKTDFITQLGITSDTYKVKVLAGSTANYLDSVVTAQNGVKKSSTGSTMTIEMDVNALTEENSISATADWVPVYDASASAHRKTDVNDLLKNAIIDGGTWT